MMERKDSANNLKEASGRLARLSPEERSAIAKKGGHASKGKGGTPYKRCDDCDVKHECEYVNTGGVCQIEVALRKQIKKRPAHAFTELGFHSPQLFFEQLAKDIVFLRTSIKARGNKPAELMGYIDRMINIAKLIYGEKHLNINVNATGDDATKILNLEKLLLDERKKINYDPKTGNMGDVKIIRDIKAEKVSSSDP